MRSSWVDWVGVLPARFRYSQAVSEIRVDGIMGHGVVPDGTPYFRAPAVTELAARDALNFFRFPSYSPKLHPVEGCWRQ